ncbi:cobyrinate a,c-diamide synthase [Desulfocurvus sp. DL9XJH121]
MPRPRIIVTGLSGGAGKTICSLGLARAFADRGLAVAPFKKGPDYIDAVWLGLAAGRPASNLDPHFMSPETIRALFAQRAEGADLSLVEGNRGLYDGLDAEGSCSTAELARILGAPVVLSMDCTKTTRTAAAILAGVAGFEEGVNLTGVILNRTAGERHRSILRQAIERYTDVPVLGALPKLDPDPIPERHMGLVSNREYGDQEAILGGLARVLAENCDLDRILSLAQAAPDMPDPVPLWAEEPQPRDVTIGYVRDAALWFYYEENLEALSRAGADLVELTLLADDPWPEIHGLYLGGGFPETQAGALAAASGVRERVRGLCRAGLPVYAECGGFMYLSESVSWNGSELPMAGVLPVKVDVCERPRGLGYVRATVRAENPFHPLGAEIQGHEFHYSCCAAGPGTGNRPPLVLSMDRGQGMLDGCDGWLADNTFASYTHIHALACPWWAGNFVRAARAFKARASV